jgi:hypothetical protein
MVTLPTSPAVGAIVGREARGGGWIALGSLLERNQLGEVASCYKWSRRVGAKTITVALSAEQFAWVS